MSRLSRKTKIVAAFAAITLTAGLAACGDDDGGSSSDTTAAGGSTDTQELTFEVVNDGQLTVCTDAPYPPFEFEDEDGNWTGFDLDIMRAFAETYGLELNVSVQPFDGIWLKPAAGDCDIVASAMTINDERAENALFSDPYYNAAQSLMVRSDDAETYTDLASLDGKTIAVQAGTTGATYAEENASGSTIQEFDDPAAMFLALDSNQVDAILQDLPVNVDRVKQMGTTAVTAVFETDENYGFAAALENTSLIDALNAVLTEMQADGRYDSLYSKYFS
jgi:polar amino acid transport system substrate-binding protein